jgi:outer membrane protein TolC
MITLRQPIPWPGKLRARAKVAESEVGIATAREHGSQRQVILDATRTYYDYRLSVRSIQTLRDNQPLLSALDQAVSARYRVGKAELIEVLKIQEAEATLGNTLLDLERQRQIAMTRINVLLARPPDSPLGEPITTPDLQALPAQQVLLEKALGHRPEIEETQAQITQAQARVEAARTERRPDFAVWGGFMPQLRGGADPTFTVGVQMSIPSFSLSRHNAAAREAVAQTSAHRATLRQTEARIQGEVQTAFLRLDTARRHLDLHRQTLIPLSERSVEAAKASYETGKVPLSFVLEAIQTLIMHHLEYEQFLVEYGQALAEMEAAIGGPLIEATYARSPDRRLP